MHYPDDTPGFSSSYTGLSPYEDPRRVPVGGRGQNGTQAYNTPGSSLLLRYTVRQESHLNTYPGAVGYTPSHGHIPPASAAYREQDFLPRGLPSFPAQNIGLEAPALNLYDYDPRANYPRQRPMTMHWQPPVEAAYGANDYVPRNRPSESYSVQNMGAVNDRIPRPTTTPPFAQPETVDPKISGPRNSIRTYTKLHTVVKARLQDVAPPLPQS
ncbi:hypothetical protein C8F01DRAFT_1254756 [Mycena amicta]|nr:hypothetical protein C8F01DRAFT_1254756 [Mycena amicta]